MFIVAQRDIHEMIEEKEAVQIFSACLCLCSLRGNFTALLIVFSISNAVFTVPVVALVFFDGVCW